jgi:TIR domain
MTGPGAITKPTVFLSHAATDEPIARVIHDEISRIFANGVKVYASSVPGVVRPGEDWLGSINDNLSAARAVIVVITPVSINRPWIWFEVGASWSRMEQGEGRILPVCYQVDKGDLPEPLGRLQAMSLGKAAETKSVFTALIDHFGFGKLAPFRYANLKAKLPRYDDLKVAETDLRSGTLYTGPYEGYSDAELREVIDEEYLHHAWQRYRDLYVAPRSNPFKGELIHFRRFDERLRLPPGTAARLLVDVARDRYPAAVAQRTENTVRFRALDDDERDQWLEARGE